MKKEERVGLQWIVTQLTRGVGLHVDKIGEKELVAFKDKSGREERRGVEVEVLTLILKKHGVLAEVWNTAVDYTAPPEEAFLDPRFLASGVRESGDRATLAEKMAEKLDCGKWEREKAAFREE